MIQMSIFDMIREPIRITKPIRLIELFAGYGSQAMALERIGAKFEKYLICEWCVQSFASYKAIHFGEDKIDYSEGISQKQLIDILFKYGISNDGKNPMTLKQIGKKPEKWLRKTYNNIKSTKNIVNIMATSGSDLKVVDTEKFTYILTYSFPCQDLSVAGKMAGMSKGSGTRSGMLWEVERILKEIRDGEGELPQILFMENVPQVHANANMGDFQNWIDFLTSLGYVSYWQDLNAKNYGVAQNRERCFMFSFLGEYNYHFPQQIPLKKKLKDYLEYDVDEKYYINNEKSEKLIKQLIENGTLPKNNHESRLALTEQSAIHIRETLQTASLQDMTQESATYGQKETVLLKAVDLSINNPKEKIIANCILSHVSKDGNTIGKYASLNTGVIECKKLKL